MDDRLELTNAAPSRRDFCAHACQALSALAVGIALEGCGGGGSPAGPSGISSLPMLAGTVNGNSVQVSVDSLASVGSAALVQATGATLLIARTAADAFNAFGAGCTHQACTITGFAAPNFACPCHGSLFSTNGDVVQGPATRALTKLSTSLAGNTLTITA